MVGKPGVLQSMGRRVRRDLVTKQQGYFHDRISFSSSQYFHDHYHIFIISIQNHSTVIIPKSKKHLLIRREEASLYSMDAISRYLVPICILYVSSELPGGSDGKEPTCHAGDRGSIPGSGRSPGGGDSNLLQCSCLENPMDRGAWWVTVHGVTKSQTRLSD